MTRWMIKSRKELDEEAGEKIKPKNVKTREQCLRKTRVDFTGLSNISVEKNVWEKLFS